MEVFALVYLQIGLLCLQIVIIVAPVAVSYGDSVLVLNRKVQGIKWSMLSLPYSIACDSRGWPWMSWIWTVAFPARVY